MDDATVANLINELIGNHSRQEFASKAGVKPMSLTRWTNGTKINLTEFDKLCSAAGRKIHEVLNFEGVTESLQKEFAVPQEYTLSVKELLKELLELQQENYLSSQPDNFIKLMTRHIRETKETLRAMKVRPDIWLTVSEFIEKITKDSRLTLILPPENDNSNISRYSVIYQLETNGRIYFCLYVTKGGGTTWSYLRDMAHKLVVVSRIEAREIHGVIPDASVWHKLLNKQFGEELVTGKTIKRKSKNSSYKEFILNVESLWEEQYLSFKPPNKKNSLDP